MVGCPCAFVHQSLESWQPDLLSERNPIDGYFNVPLVFAFKIIASYSFMSFDMSIVPRRSSDLSLSLSNRRHTAPSKTGTLSSKP
jgi:hypothetical protein